MLWDWRANAREWKVLNLRVAKIQAMYRAKVERRAVAQLRALLDDQNGRARVLCMRIVNRFTVTLLRVVTFADLLSDELAVAAVAPQRVGVVSCPASLA